MATRPNATCSVCSKPVYRGPTSRPEIVCHECRRNQPRQHGRSRRSPIYQPRPCAECGEIFQPNPTTKGRPRQRYCSRSCATRATNRARAGTLGLTPEQMQERGKASSKASARRRRMIVATTWDGVTDEEILKRDQWMCWICKRRIGKTLKFPHPRSVSIDHLIPLALGGDDTAFNKKSAHLGCNMSRGTGKVDEHPMLNFSLEPDAEITLRKRGRPCVTCGETPGSDCKLHMPVYYFTCCYCGKLTASQHKRSPTCGSSGCKRQHSYASHDRKVEAGKPHKRGLEAYAMHERGMTWDEIADQLGYSRANLAAAAAAKATGKRSARRKKEYVRLARVVGVPSQPRSQTVTSHGACR